MKVTEECKELFEAIAAAQGEFTTVEKNASNPHFKSKFAPLDSIIEMIRPILPKHGLSVTQHCDIPETGAGIIVETVIAHKSGQYISSRLFMPVVKQDPQGYGSSITYGRRYALGAALGIVSDEDVDGNQTENPAQKGRQTAKTDQQSRGTQQGASSPSPDAMTEGQRKMIFAKLKAKNVSEDSFKAAFKLASVADLKKAHVNEALTWIDGAAQSA